MIDPECPIVKAGKGYCWIPSRAWGKTDDELCAVCMVKNMLCRYCGANYSLGQVCSAQCGVQSAEVIPITITRRRKVG